MILLVTDTFVVKLSLKKINENPPPSHKYTEAQKMSTFSASLGERDAGSQETLSCSFVFFL